MALVSKKLVSNYLIRNMMGKHDCIYPITEAEYNTVLNDLDFWYEAKSRGLEILRLEKISE